MKTKTIHELLTDPEYLLTLTDAELKALLTPYIPLARQAVLPEEKSSKVGLEIKALREAIKDPKLLALMKKK